MTMNTTGAHSGGNPACTPRSTRKASENRAKENRAATPVTIHTGRPSRPTAESFSGAFFSPEAVARRAGSFTQTTRMTTAITAGMMAKPNTLRMSPASTNIKRMARAGPTKAPTVSRAWRTP
jgi:hypothetical protein